ncbi:YqiA/YcfP family alpha/beta fold hydrolase [Geitlerinema splendidum]|nr:YqiA/YcfP family alpha/beta fold hydrolase [Geitlerinema splendidum]
MVHYLYLHGFASSPQSAKAQDLGDRFSRLNLSLNIPDLNQGDFSHLTLTRQIQQVSALFPPGEAVRLIGSSFGGLTSAWLGEKYPQVERLVLLAPAFGFLEHWLPQIGEVQLRQWQQENYQAVYHYGEKRSLPLHYGFISDVRQYCELQLTRPVPTLILHGIEDRVIPIQASRDYQRDRPWVQLVELDSDHSLGNVLPEIGLAIQSFFSLE